ncbi:MAG: nucleotidyltransferase domain-containing protein [Actinobacteria bacterium]|nr:nucleotidyltransferase domain-containing protein [Actinomycetota bacterium]
MLNYFELTKSKVRRKILSYFFSNTVQELYLREIARLIDEDPGNLSKELSKLEKEQLFISRFRGNQKYYYLNKEYPLFNEIKSVIFKTIGVKGLIQNLVTYSNGIIAAFIYGSYANNTEKSYSDIDLCLIIDNNVFKDDAFVIEINKIEKTISRDMEYIYYSEVEWNQKIKSQDSFIMNLISQPKIILIGEIPGL